MSRHTDAIASVKNKLYERIALRDPKLAAQVRELRLDWYRITNEVAEDGTPETADVFIYDEIGGSFGVDADTFVKELNDITAPLINVRINSPGGSLFDSIAIHNALVSHSAEIHTYVDALAASGASIISQAGDKRFMMPGSQLMIHDALGVEVGNQRDHELIAALLGRQSDNIADLYASKAGGTREEWRARMLAETWMFAGEAIDMGLADEQYAPSKPDEGDGEEDAPPEEEPQPEELVTAHKDLEILMHRKFPLNGFKYRGREKAPAPKVNALSDAQLARIQNALLRKVR